MSQDMMLPSVQRLQLVQKAMGYLRPTPSTDTTQYFRKTCVTDVKEIFGTTKAYELTMFHLTRRLSAIMGELSEPRTSLSDAASPTVLGLRLALEDYASLHERKRVFSFPLRGIPLDGRLIDVDGYVLEEEGQHKDIRPPFMFVNSTSETLQITVDPKRVDPIAFQIAVSWWVPSKRGDPDASWTNCYWRQVVAASGMYLTVEMTSYLVNEAERVLERVFCHAPPSTVTSSLARHSNVETIPEDGTKTWDIPSNLSNERSSSHEHRQSIASMAELYHSQSDFPEEALRVLMKGVVRDNLQRLGKWIHHVEVDRQHCPKPSMLIDAFSVMENVIGQKSPDSLNRTCDDQGFIISPWLTVNGDYDYIFANECGQVAEGGAVMWRFISSHSRIMAKSTETGGMKKKVRLVFELAAKFQSDQAAPRDVSVQQSNIFQYKQLDAFRERLPAEKLACSTASEDGLASKTYSQLTQSFRETFVTATSVATICATLT